MYVLCAFVILNKDYFTLLYFTLAQLAVVTNRHRYTQATSTHFVHAMRPNNTDNSNNNYKFNINTVNRIRGETESPILTTVT